MMLGKVMTTVPDLALGVLLQTDTCVEDSLFLHVANACYDIGLLRQLSMRTVYIHCYTIKVIPLRELWDTGAKFMHSVGVACIVSFRCVVNASSTDKSVLS